MGLRHPASSFSGTHIPSLSDSASFRLVHIPTSAGCPFSQYSFACLQSSFLGRHDPFITYLNEAHIATLTGGAFSCWLLPSGLPVGSPLALDLFWTHTTRRPLHLFVASLACSELVPVHVRLLLREVPMCLVHSCSISPHRHMRYTVAFGPCNNVCNDHSSYMSDLQYTGIVSFQLVGQTTQADPRLPWIACERDGHPIV